MAVTSVESTAKYRIVEVRTVHGDQYWIVERRIFLFWIAAEKELGCDYAKRFESLPAAKLWIKTALREGSKVVFET